MRKKTKKKSEILGQIEKIRAEDKKEMHLSKEEQRKEAKPGQSSPVQSDSDRQTHFVR